jgi:hypothetical protein
LIKKCYVRLRKQDLNCYAERLVPTNYFNGDEAMQWRKKSPVTLSFVLLLSAVMLSGCSQPVRNASPDEPWPELDEQTQGCVAISGRYSSSPRLHGKTEKLDTPLLAYTLLPASPKLADADRVVLKVTETQLSVTAYAGEMLLMSHVYHAQNGNFECIADSLEFRAMEKSGTVQAVADSGLDWETIRLRRTVDGSLLLQEAGGLASLAFMLFPIYFTSDHWYLFKPVE